MSAIAGARSTRNGQTETQDFSGETVVPARVGGATRPQQATPTQRTEGAASVLQGPALCVTDGRETRCLLPANAEQRAEAERARDAVVRRSEALSRLNEYRQIPRPAARPVPSSSGLDTGNQARLFTQCGERVAASPENEALRRSLTREAVLSGAAALAGGASEAAAVAMEVCGGAVLNLEEQRGNGVRGLAEAAVRTAVGAVPFLSQGVRAAELNARALGDGDERLACMREANASAANDLAAYRRQAATSRGEGVQAARGNTVDLARRRVDRDYHDGVLAETHRLAQ